MSTIFVPRNIQPIVCLAKKFFWNECMQFFAAYEREIFTKQNEIAFCSYINDIFHKKTIILKLFQKKWVKELNFDLTKFTRTKLQYRIYTFVFSVSSLIILFKLVYLQLVKWLTFLRIQKRFLTMSEIKSTWKIGNANSVVYLILSLKTLAFLSNLTF